MQTNLKPARKAAGYTQASAAKASGIPLGTLRRWEQGVSGPDMESILKLATLYNVSTDTLLGGKFANEESGFVRSIPFSSAIDVPVYKTFTSHNAAGNQVVDVYPIPMKIYRQYPKSFFLEVKDEAIDKLIPQGNYALVDFAQQEIHDLQPYAVSVRGEEAFVILVRELKNGLELVPASTDPTYRPQAIDFAESDSGSVNVLGKVVWHAVPFDWKY